MTYTRFVEVGRIVVISYGKDNGKLAAVVDVGNGVKRQVIPYKQIALTDLKVDFAKGASSADVEAATGSVQADFDKCAWGTKIANKGKRLALTDFERYKVMVARQKRAKIIKAAM